MTYTGTWLWKTAFVDTRSDATPEEQAFFAARYEAMREKAAHLVSRIAVDMPQMTVHDITHLDALWEMGSIVAQERISFNPPEAFVFGGAVLLHDAAMSLAAFEGGLEGLKEHVAWQDSYARLVTQAQDRGEDPDLEKISALATADALRRLHALQAERLPTMSWARQLGDPEFLIDDQEVRNFYGPKIGQIAHSHWSSVAEVADDLANDLGPLGGRTSSRIDLVKIACVLRVSDAMHLDRRRAPAFLAKLLQPEGLSASHWAFQERMAVPFVDGEALVYSAAPAFELAQAEAWWLAYDAAAMVDRELREVDHVLQRRGEGRLAAGRVKGVGSPGAFANYVETIGWTPVDSTVRVSDVPKIVATLGGAKLYGDDPKAAVRELIQNAADAIDARRRIQKKRAEDWGEITVGLDEREEGHWLWVEDTGVGMSAAVLTGPLIDFGNSFWRSPFAAEEFPGMQAEGISATGRYGIGFFSVFMLGDRVRVISRRYDKGTDAAKALEFMSGLGSRPILYSPTFSDIPLDGGTRVEVLLRISPDDERGVLGELDEDEDPHESLGRMVASIAPSVPVKISVSSKGRSTVVTTPQDWLSLPEKRLLCRLRRKIPGEDGPKPKKSRLRPLVGDDGTVYGRAAIGAGLFSNHAGCIAVGGLRASEVNFLNGILLGRESTAARNEAYAVAPGPVLKAWASEQADLIAKAELSGEDKALAAQVVLHCGGDIGKLPVARLNREWISESRLRAFISKSTKSIVIYEGSRVVYDEDSDEVHPREFSDHFKDADDVIFVPTDHPGYYSFRVAGLESLRFATPVDGREDLVSLVFSMIESMCDRFGEPDHEDLVVGKVLRTDIVRPVKLYPQI